MKLKKPLIKYHLIISQIYGFNNMTSISKSLLYEFGGGEEM